jgi:hypothetical protein
MLQSFSYTTDDDSYQLGVRATIPVEEALYLRNLMLQKQLCIEWSRYTVQMEASCSTIAQKSHVSEAQGAIVQNSAAGEALQNTLVQISGVDEAFQDTAAQNTHAVETLIEYIIPQAIGLVLVELGKAFLTLNALSRIFVCIISIKYKTVSCLLS